MFRDINILVIDSNQKTIRSTSPKVHVRKIGSKKIRFLNKQDNFDGLIILDFLDSEQINNISTFAKAHCAFWCDDVLPSTNSKEYNEYYWFEKKYICNIFKREDFSYIINNAFNIFHPDNNGGSYGNTYFQLNNKLKNNYIIKGENEVEFFGYFGTTFQQCLSCTIKFAREYSDGIEAFPEFDIKGDIALKYEIYEINNDSDKMTLAKSEIVNCNNYSISVKNNNKQIKNWYISVSIKGNGNAIIRQIQVYALRDNFGKYSLRASFLQKENKDPVLAYFNPGNLKPPLIVYFSGYHTSKGIEAFNLINSLKCPFIIFSDCRAEGGQFYIGDKSFNSYITKYIKSKLDYLQFSNKQAIFSGLSMGTTGALFYGSIISPYAILCGKPVCNIGTVAMQEKIYRNNVFPTSLDYYNYISDLYNCLNEQDVNDVFWNQFRKIQNNKTIISLTCMQQDDYDINACKDIEEILYKKNKIVLYKKMLKGRHNDKTQDVIAWWKTQIYKILSTDFNRVYE